MKKAHFLLLAIAIFAISGCKKDVDDKKDADDKGHEHLVGTYITNLHAPTSATDSITFTADSSYLAIKLFSPLGGVNRVMIHDLTSGTYLFNDTVSALDKTVDGFTPNHNYSVMGYSGSGSPTTFGYAASSFRNSGLTPSPFAGYTQYFNSSSSQGPGDGVVIFVMEEPTSGSGKR
jgi:hypothetical protein